MAKPPAATGASALVFHEKEKEYQKELNALRKQVRTLQKILYSKETTAPSITTSVGRAASKPLQRARSDVSKQNANSNPHQNLIRSIRNTGVDASSVFPRSTDILSFKIFKRVYFYIFSLMTVLNFQDLDRLQ